MTDTRPFRIHAADDSRDTGHTVRAETVEDAAFAFVDRWHPPLDASGDVLLQRLDERISSHNADGERQFTISMGRGMARFDPDRPKSLQQLLEEADTRLYVNKRATKAARNAHPSPN